MLFRLVNYFRPKSLIEVGIGNGASIGYMRAACHTMDSVTLKGRDWAKTSRQLEEKLAEVHTLDCLHIGHTPFYKEVFELVLPYAGPRSCFIVGVILDLYDIGLVFFDKARYKQHYIVNFL